MLEAGYEKTQEVLFDQSYFELDEVKFQEFVALLDAPPLSKEKLYALLTTQPPWDVEPDQDKLNPLD